MATTMAASAAASTWPSSRSRRRMKLRSAATLWLVPRGGGDLLDQVLAQALLGFRPRLAARLHERLQVGSGDIDAGALEIIEHFGFLLGAHLQRDLAALERCVAHHPA